jgi:hypothetical protein
MKFNLNHDAEAVPKRILELMSVHGLTRENVASHLQVYIMSHDPCINYYAGFYGLLPEYLFNPLSTEAFVSCVAY